MSNRRLRVDLATAAAVAVLVLILAPGLAVVAMVAIAVLLACLISGVREGHGRRRGASGRAIRGRRGRRNVSAGRPARR